MYLSFFVDVTTLFLTFLNFIVMLLMSMEEFSSLENLGKRVLCYLHSLGLIISLIIIRLVLLLSLVTYLKKLVFILRALVLRRG